MPHGFLTYAPEMINYSYTAMYLNCFNKHNFFLSRICYVQFLQVIIDNLVNEFFVKVPVIVFYS